MRKLLLISAALTLVVAPGCAITSAALDADDGRTVAASISDMSAARTIRARMLRAHGFKLGGVDVEVRGGTALLTGHAPRPEDRVEAERIAWSAPQVADIGNEIMVGDKQTFVRNAKDGVLEKSVRTRLIASDVSARDLNIETHDGVIYMLGIVDSLEERDEATRIASTTRGAREVVSYLRVMGDPDPATALSVDNAPRAPIQTAPQQGTPRAGAIPAAPLDMPEEVVRATPVVPVSPLSDVPGGGEMVIEEIPIPPDAGTGAPFYIDPDSGARIPVRFDEPR